MAELKPFRHTVVSEATCAGCGSKIIVRTRVKFESWTEGSSPNSPTGFSSGSVRLLGKIVGVALSHDCTDEPRETPHPPFDVDERES
jgi:hypothetical protein